MHTAKLKSLLSTGIHSMIWEFELEPLNSYNIVLFALRICSACKSNSSPFLKGAPSGLALLYSKSHILKYVYDPRLAFTLSCHNLFQESS